MYCERCVSLRKSNCHLYFPDNNGILDGEEDSDDDGLGNVEEQDCDLDPANPDSDDEGVSDGDEDSDGDGVTNHDEEVEGTDPAQSDDATSDDGSSDNSLDEGPPAFDEE